MSASILYLPSRQIAANSTEGDKLSAPSSQSPCANSSRRVVMTAGAERSSSSVPAPALYLGFAIVGFLMFMALGPWLAGKVSGL